MKPMLMKSKSCLVAFALLLCGVLCSPAFAANEAQDRLVASDAVRNPGKPFGVTIVLTEFRAGKQVDTSTLTTYSRMREQGGQFASLVRYAAPARDEGKLILKNGNEMWFFDPVTKASVRLSPQQRLLGQASNGDVVTVNFAKDYQATLAGEEEIVDGDRKKTRAVKLTLAAAVPDVTYSAIELWIDAETNRPLKSRFFAESGRLLKTAYYRKYEMQLGVERPTETVIIDGLDPQSVTLMRFSNYAFKSIPDTWLHRDYLPRFQE